MAFLLPSLPEQPEVRQLTDSAALAFLDSGALSTVFSPQAPQPVFPSCSRSSTGALTSTGLGRSDAGAELRQTSIYWLKKRRSAARRISSSLPCTRPFSPAVNPECQGPCLFSIPSFQENKARVYNTCLAAQPQHSLTTQGTISRRIIIVPLHACERTRILTLRPTVQSSRGTTDSSWK